MVVGTITPPLILARILELAPADTAYLDQHVAPLLGAGSALADDAPRPRRLRPAQRHRHQLRVLAAAGAGRARGRAPAHARHVAGARPRCRCSSRRFVPRLRRVFTPLVSGVVVLLIGLSLIPSAMASVAAPLSPTAPGWASAVVALAVMAVVVAAQLLDRPWARLASVLLGIAAGYLVCALGGWLHAPEPGDDGLAAAAPAPAPRLRLPRRISSCPSPSSTSSPRWRRWAT